MHGYILCSDSSTATIFDSLRQMKLQGHVKIQIAMIAQQQELLLIVRPQCKQQTNSYDCLLFAIANAVEFCHTLQVQNVDFDETAV